VASDKDKPLIIVPRPGEFLALLGASGALQDAALDAINDFTRARMKQDGPLKKVTAPPQISYDWGSPDGDYSSAAAAVVFDSAAFKKMVLGEFPPAAAPEVPAAPVEESSKLIEFFAYETVGMIPPLLPVVAAEGCLAAATAAFGQPAVLPALDGGAGVDIAFWYYRSAFLIYSIRRTADNYFYDFATKKFSLLPANPRAGLGFAAPARPAGYLYSTRLSGQLADGEYVVTCRDTQADDIVVGIMALYMKDGQQELVPPPPAQGLEDTPVEEGIATPEGTFRRAERRVRAVDTDGPA
jgi:hypothetical protein